MFNTDLSYFNLKLKMYLVKLIEKFSTDYLNKQIRLSSEKDIKKIIKLLEEYYPNFNEESYKEFLEKKENIEINKSIDILLGLMNMDQKQMTFFEGRLIKSALKELKLFRNLFSKDDKNITDELIQRYFENVFFLFKYIKFPKSNMDLFDYDDSFQDEITFQVQNSLLINTRKSYSFKLNYAKSEDILKNHTSPLIGNYEEDMQLKKIFENKVDLTLLAKEKHEINLLNNEMEINEDKNLRIFIEKDRYDNSRTRKKLNKSISNKSGNVNNTSLKIGMKTFSNESQNVNSKIIKESEKVFEIKYDIKDKTLNSNASVTLNSNVSISLGETNNFESGLMSLDNSKSYSLNDKSDL